MNNGHTYLTRDGEVLDAIAYRCCGSEQFVHALLAANPQLARLPAHLPAGLVINLPAAPVPHTPAVAAQTVRLWA